jgi:predicted metal-dependent hydrolase
MIFGFLRTALKKAPPLSIERPHEVGGRTLPMRIIENARAKRLTLRIDTGGKGLRVTVPSGIAMRDIDEFILRHQGWLEARLDKYPDRPKLRPGVKLPLRGVNHVLIHEAGARGAVEQGMDEDGAYLMVYGDLRHFGRRLTDFLKREAKRDIEPMALALAAGTIRKVKSVKFKDTSSRWGSCSSDGNLSFSWRIMMAPKPVIAYLVAHEVAHLTEMNHGPKFWKLTRELCPDMERAKAWLKRNGAALQSIEF